MLVVRLESWRWILLVEALSVESSIFNKRLLIITGKGGVGKTTVSCSLAVAAARKGKRVLVVEVGATDHVGPLFEAKNRTGYKESKVWNTPDKKVQGSVYAARLESEDALHEFVLRQIKSEIIYRLIFKNRVIRYFTAVAPGLEELMILGKIVDLAKEVGRDGKAKWDLVILDAPSTGHGVSFLRIPQVALKMVQVGPLQKHFLQLWEFLRDGRSTAINIVSLPEEMPVNESIELSEEIDDKLDVATGLIFANGVFSELFDEREKIFYDRLCDSVVDELDPEKKTLWKKITEAASRRRTRADLHARYVSRLRQEIEWPLVQLPYLSGGQIATKDLCLLAEHLSAS